MKSKVAANDRNTRDDCSDGIQEQLMEIVGRGENITATPILQGRKNGQRKQQISLEVHSRETLYLSALQLLHKGPLSPSKSDRSYL